MHFNLVFGNHWNFGIVVADTLLMIQYALQELGFTANINKDLDPSATNILLDGFDEEYVEKLKQLRDDGGKLWLVATEELSELGFNATALNKKDKSHYSNQEYWQKRYDNFAKVIPLVECLFHPNQTQLPIYEKIFSKECYFLPHGFTTNFKTVQHRANKDIDFVFTGALTEYRTRFFEELKRKGYNVTTLPVLSASFYRDDIIARSKVALNIRQTEDWPHFSNSRANYHLCNESALVSQYCPIHCDVANYIEMPESDFMDHAIWLLETGKWQTVAKHAYQIYSSQHRLANLLQPLFVKLGILQYAK